MIDVTIDGGIGHIRLNRPDAANSLDLEMARQLRDAAVKCAGDPAVRCVLLSAEGKAFCAGGDVAAFSQADDLPALLTQIAEALHEGIAVLMRMEKPLVSLVNGVCAGAGFGLAICADVVIAARSGSFLAAYSGVGLTPDGGLSWLLPRMVGMRRAQDLIITNRRISAEEALAMGLITAMVEDGDLAAAGAKMAAKLAASATQAIGSAKTLLLSGTELSIEDQLALESRGIAAAGGRAESREGVAAFLAKRKPDFAGAGNS